MVETNLGLLAVSDGQFLPKTSFQVIADLLKSIEMTTILKQPAGVDIEKARQCLLVHLLAF